MAKKQRVKHQLGELHKELSLALTFLDSKLLWMSVFEGNDLNFECPIRDGDVMPPIVVRTIRTNSGQLRAFRPHIENEMRRAFLNDMYLVPSRHAVIIDNLLRGRDEPRPEFSPERRDAALDGLNRFLSKADKRFMDFMRRLRNSVIHYEGRYNAANPMNDELLGKRIETTAANVGESIVLSLPQLYHIHSEVTRILDADNLLQHPQMRRELA